MSNKNKRKYYCLMEQLRRDDKVVYFHMDEDGHFTGTTYIRNMTEDECFEAMNKYIKENEK